MIYNDKGLLQTIAISFVTVNRAQLNTNQIAKDILHSQWQNRNQKL